MGFLVVPRSLRPNAPEAAVAGLPDMRWHDLRHPCASLLLAQSVPHRVVMETLGHSQVSLTMRSSHLIPELRSEAAASIERILAVG